MPRVQLKTAANARMAWADYCRNRRNPTKECSRCGVPYPNDRDHFHVTTSGRITKHCLKCEVIVRKERVDIAATGPARSDCPVCDTFDVLVIDHKSPQPIRMCRGCLSIIDSFRRPCRTSVPVRMNRMVEYVLWQQGIPRSQAKDSIALMKQLPVHGLGQLARVIPTVG